MKNHIDNWVKVAYEKNEVYEIVNIRKREIYWTDYDSIDGETVQRILSILDKLEELDSTKDVTIFLNNEGGNPEASFIFIERIKDLPFKINVHGEGLIASAATILLMGTTGKKTLNRYAHMMFHQISSWSFGKERKDDAKSRLQYYDTLTDMIVDLYVKNSTLKKEDWEKMMAKDTYVSAKKCLDFGIIDGIK